MAYYADDSIILRYKSEKKAFFERNRIFKKFKYIDEEKKNEIQNDAFLWNEKYTFDTNLLKTLAIFTTLRNNNMNRILGRQVFSNNYLTSDEELLFYLFSIDPELKLLQIYYDENNIDEVKKRFFQEFSLDYDARLLKIELMYNKKFPTIIDEFAKTQVLSREKNEGEI